MFKSGIDINVIKNNMAKVIEIHKLLGGDPMNSLDIPGYDNDIYMNLINNIDEYETPILIDDYVGMVERLGGLSNPIKFNIRSLKSSKMITYQQDGNIICPACYSEVIKGNCECKESTEDEIKHEKKNIEKHYDNNISKIFGSEGKSKDCFSNDDVIDYLRERIKASGIDIVNAPHCTNRLVEYLKNIRSINVKGKTYVLKNYINKINYILLRLYPEIEIPKLYPDEANAIKSAFMTIAVTYHDLFPNKYKINYLYVISRTIFHLYPNNPRAMELLRYIYIQKIESFKSKDDKLKQINDKTGLFPNFKYTPIDFYCHVYKY